jgi:hypothetical protein
MSAYSHDVHPIVYQGPDAKITSGVKWSFVSTGTGITIVDAEDKDRRFSSFSIDYAQSGYTHQGYVGESITAIAISMMSWMSKIWEQHPNVHHGHCRPGQSFHCWFYEADVEAIDHNMYIIGDKMYQSNYLSGLRILDVNGAPDRFIGIGRLFRYKPFNGYTRV